MKYFTMIEGITGITWVSCGYKERREQQNRRKAVKCQRFRNLSDMADEDIPLSHRMEECSIH